jgi:hypothetical protein
LFGGMGWFFGEFNIPQHSADLMPMGRLFSFVYNEYTWQTYERIPIIQTFCIFSACSLACTLHVYASLIGVIC